MPTNFFFQNGGGIGQTSEQRLIEDLIIESRKIYGHDTYYLPRTLVKKDTIFDEDTLSSFTQAYPIEMYLENNLPLIVKYSVASLGSIKLCLAPLPPNTSHIQ